MANLFAAEQPDGTRKWYASAVPTLSTDGSFGLWDLLEITGGAQAGQIYICTASGTPGTWVPVTPAKSTQGGTSSATQYFTAGQAIENSTQGVDTAGVATSVFIGSIYIPTPQTLTGIQFLIGSVGGTDKVVVVLYNAAGAVVANSALNSSVTVGTAATVQQVPFTATYAAAAGVYFIGVSTNGTTAKIRTVFAGSNQTTIQSGQTFNTLTSITPPTTFTTAQEPVGGTY